MTHVIKMLHDGIGNVHPDYRPGLPECEGRFSLYPYRKCLNPAKIMIDEVPYCGNHANVRAFDILLKESILQGPITWTPVSERGT